MANWNDPESEPTPPGGAVMVIQPSLLVACQLQLTIVVTPTLSLFASAV
jgi:hypothetical protein